MAKRQDLDKDVYVSVVVSMFFENIVPIRKSIKEVGDGYRLFRFTDKNTLKEYILSSIDENQSHSDLIYVINEIFVSSQELENKEYDLVVPKLVKNKLGRLHGWRKYNHDPKCLHGCYYPLDRCNVKLFEINSDLTTKLSDIFRIHEEANGKNDIEERYLLMGWSAGKIFKLINSNELTLSCLKSVPMSTVNELNSIEELQRISKTCRWRVQGSKSLVHQTFEEFARIKSKFEELPDFILNLQNLNDKVLIDVNGTGGYNLYLFDLYRLKPGKLVEDVARIMVAHILKQTLYSFKDALTQIAPHIIAGYESAKIFIPNKELVLVPTLMRIRLSHMIIGREFIDHPNIALRNEYHDKAPALLRLLVKDPVFGDSKKLIKMWRTLLNTPTEAPKTAKQSSRPKEDKKNRNRRSK